MDMGFYVSFAGNLTFPKAQNLREVAVQIPRERLLIETDSPFLAPVPQRGKRNEPAFVRHTAEQLAALLGLSAEEMGDVTTRNFLEFLKGRT
jgi:TatD DNase family protein